MFQRLLIVLALVLFVGVTAARAQSDEEAGPKAPTFDSAKTLMIGT